MGPRGPRDVQHEADLRPSSASPPRSQTSWQTLDTPATVRHWKSSSLSKLHWYPSPWPSQFNVPLSRILSTTCQSGWAHNCTSLRLLIEFYLKLNVTIDIPVWIMRRRGYYLVAQITLVWLTHTLSSHTIIVALIQCQEQLQFSSGKVNLIWRQILHNTMCSWSNLI